MSDCLHKNMIRRIGGRSLSSKSHGTEKYPDLKCTTKWVTPVFWLGLVAIVTNILTWGYSTENSITVWWVILCWVLAQMGTLSSTIVAAKCVTRNAREEIFCLNSWPASPLFITQIIIGGTVYAMSTIVFVAYALKPMAEDNLGSAMVELGITALFLVTCYWVFLLFTRETYLGNALEVYE